MVKRTIKDKRHKNSHPNLLGGEFCKLQVENNELKHDLRFYHTVSNQKPHLPSGLFQQMLQNLPNPREIFNYQGYGKTLKEFHWENEVIDQQLGYRLVARRYRDVYGDRVVVTFEKESKNNKFNLILTIPVIETKGDIKMYNYLLPEIQVIDDMDYIVIHSIARGLKESGLFG